MKARTSGLIALALVPLTVIGAAIGFATANGDDREPVKPPAAGLSEADIEKAAEAAGIPPKPDQATADAYIAALRKIDPEIVGDKDPDRLVSRGRDQCSSIKAWPNDQAKVLKLANTRFTAPEHPNGFGVTKARKINEAVHKYICPAY